MRWICHRESIIWMIIICINGLQSEGEPPRTTVQSFVDDENVRPEIFIKAFVGRRQVIQLNITLLAAAFDSNYNVLISTVKQENNTITCDQVSCGSYNVPKETLTTILPKNGEHLTDYDSCRFQHLCTYKVVIGNSENTEKFKAFYKIEDCVDEYCSCYGRKSNLPMPSLGFIEIDNNELYFNYSIPKSSNRSSSIDFSLKSLDIYIQEMSHCDIIHSSMNFVEHSSKILNFYNELKFEGDHKKTNLLNKSLNSECLYIKLNVIDYKNCAGPELLKILKVSELHKTTTALSSHTIFALIIIVLLFFVILINVLFILKRKKRRGVGSFEREHFSLGAGGTVNSNVMPLIPMTTNPIYLVDDMYEIPRVAIEFGREIGKGAFGRVYIAKLAEIPGKFHRQNVAVKRLKKSPSPDVEEEFLGEIETMKKVGIHPNVVRLLGYCKKDNPLLMVMEYVPCGDLLKYLKIVRAKLQMKRNLNNFPNGLSSVNFRNQTNSSRINLNYPNLQHNSSSSSDSYITHPADNNNLESHQRTATMETTYTGLTTPNYKKEEQKPTLEYEINHEELHDFALQIARGMKHLEGLKITHRDLAARNVLIDEFKTLKISDFGLSRDGVYVNTKHKKVPLRWLSIEAMRDNFYSNKSDVWAFAVLLWEIGTLGGHPYPTVDNAEMLKYLSCGNRLEKPEACSEFLYALMLDCWNENQDDRPNFSSIYERLTPNKTPVYIDFTVINPTYEFPPIDGV